MVQKWHSRFERMRHAHPVHLRQHVIGQGDFDVEIHQPIKWIFKRALRKKIAQKILKCQLRDVRRNQPANQFTAKQ